MFGKYLYYIYIFFFDQFRRVLELCDFHTNFSFICIYVFTNLLGDYKTLREKKKKKKNLNYWKNKLQWLKI